MGKTDQPVTMYPPTPLLRDETVVEVEPGQRYITQRYTEEALSFIEANCDRPFFLYLPHSMPHWPQYASHKFVGQSGNGPWGDAVEEIDWSTGQILDQLQRLGIDDHTMVIFASDNGGATHHGAANAPLRGGKGTTWEGGQRVCCIIARWPNSISAESQCNAIATTFDLLPTFARFAGATLPQERTIDGEDIGPLLTGKTDASLHGRFFYYFCGHLNAVRSGKWKLFTKRGPRGKQTAGLSEPELYNLTDDIGETNNVAAENAEVVNRLTKYLRQMRNELGDGPSHPGEDVRPAGYVPDAKPLTSDAPNTLQKTDVFVSGRHGFHTFRVPSLLVTQKGSLLAICEGRKTGRADHGDLDLVVKRSENTGATWSNLQTIYEEGGNKKITIGNPCPVVDQATGTIWLPFCRDNDDVLITYRKNDGKTWAQPKDITDHVKLNDWTCMQRNLE